MSLRRVAALAAVGSVIAWGLKAAAIAVAGGLDRSPLEAPLFGLGLFLLVVAFVATGLAMTSGRGTGMRIAGALGSLLIGFLMFLLVEEAVGALVPDSAGWVKEEAGLWAASGLAAAALLVWSRRQNEPHPQ